MGQYDFDCVVDRSGTDSLKWERGGDEIPLWVADMDFMAPREVREALIRRASHGVFGYSVIPDRWREAYVSWWQRRHGLELDPAWLVFATGVVPAISSAVRRLTAVGDKVVIQTPVYNIFFNSILNNGRHVLESPLIWRDGQYSMDFDDLERCLADPETTMMILCNPHNPVGRIWSREELARVGSLCRRHGVTVISDEIHCDLTAPGKAYVPFAGVSEDCREISVTCVAPSKTFNLAGLQSAAVFAANSHLRERISRGLNTDEVAEPNAFAVEGAVAAYTWGAEWLDELRSYIQDSRDLVAEFARRHLPGICPVDAEATYLIWLDCSGILDGGSSVPLTAFLRSQAGVRLSPGDSYGTGGRGFLRLNAACPRQILEEGLRRLERGLEMFWCREQELKQQRDQDLA